MLCRLLRVGARRFSKPTLTNELETDYNWTHRQDTFEKYYSKNDPISGFCTPEGTLSYSKLNPETHPTNFKQAIDGSSLTLSSVGVGTYSLDMDIQTDLAMYNAIIDSVMSGGVNVIDSCASFRHSKSERIVNAALMFLIKEKGYLREQVLVATKAGYVADDADNNTKGMDLVREMVKEGVMAS